MDDQYGLKADVIQQIQTVFSGFPAIEQAILYGSRAKGNCRHGSDIDLTLKINGGGTLHLLTGIMNALDDLDLPYGFDISLFEQITNGKLLDHINRVGVEFYNANTFAAQQQSRKKRLDYSKKLTQSEAQ